MTEARYNADDPAGSGDYPLNCWYVVATSDEVGRSLLARQALGRRLLAFRQANGEVAVLRGPLQYAAPLDHRMDVIRSYEVEGFHDYDVHPVDIAQGYRMPVLDAQAPGLGLTFEARAGGDRSLPWDEARPLLRHGDATLVPLGCTLLRRAAFPIR